MILLHNKFLIDKDKTYIHLKENLQEMPSLYIKDGNKLLLVNYRVKGSYLIVDRLFTEAELRIDNKKSNYKKEKIGDLYGRKKGINH